jgi:pyruvate carboxylase subunit B
MKYTVTIGSRTFEVHVEGGEARLDGSAAAAALVALPGGVERQLVLPDGRQTFGMTPVDGGWELVWAGEVIRAQVVDERTRAIRALTGRTLVGGGRQTIKAPMPGLVVRVEVEPGAAVRAGQGVVVLEAMKMENELTSPVAGTVTAVRVVPGQTVEKGSPLVEVSGQG